MSWTVTCSLFVYIYLRRLFHYSMATFFDTAVVVAHSLKRVAAGSSCSFLVCIMVSIILLLLSETELTLQSHRVLSITFTRYPLRSVTFKGILGKLRPFTVGVAKLCVSHKMGFSGGPNMMRDRRTYRTASDIFH